MMNLRLQMVFFWGCLGWLVSQSAYAEEAAATEKKEEPKALEELGLTPPFRVVAFKDSANYGDCNSVDSRRGFCIERVDFVDFIPPWSLADNYGDASKFGRNMLRFVYLLRRPIMDRNKINQFLRRSL